MLEESSVQDEFLKNLCESNKFGSVYLISGIQLKGIFTGFDEQSIFLRSQNSSNEQMVYKHAVATIVPFDEPR